MLKSVELLISLGYSNKDAENITSSFLLVTLKDETLCKKINENFNYLISLGYTRADVINMTKILPTLYSLSKESIEEKIRYLRDIGLEDIVINDTRQLIQSVFLTYARYEFLTKEKEILIDESNYRKLFCGETNFKKQYGVSKNVLLKKYSYEKYKGSIKS